MHPLDRLLSIEEYPVLFTNTLLWAPYVRQACSQLGLPCQDVTAGTIPGTFPTFLCDRRWVVKFFGPLFGGAECYEVERCAARLLADHPVIPAAKLLGEGRLVADRANWNWPYLIFEYVEGESLRSVFEQLSLPEKLAAAGKLGGWVRALHDLPLPVDGSFDQDWTGFKHFLAAQYAWPASRHNLPAHLAAQIDQFIYPPEDLLDPFERPHLIHADLTGDHLFGQWINGSWQASALIDFGDACTGSLYYELAALQMDMFQCDRRLLAAFLSAYGLKPQVDFTRRALVFCLLHEFDVLDEISRRLPVVNSLPSLQDLADLLFSVSPD